MEACERMTELMSAALDGELTAEEQSALDAHLAQCGDCRALMVLWKRLIRHCTITDSLKIFRTGAESLRVISSPQHTKSPKHIRHRK